MRGRYPNRTSCTDAVGDFGETDVEWTFEADAPIDSSPAIAEVNGTDVVAFGENNHTGSDFYILNASNGDKLWNYSTGNAFFSSPAIEDIDGNGEREIVTGGDDGCLYAFNYSKGSFGLYWKYEANSSVSSSPVVGEVDGEKSIFFGSFGDPGFYAVDGSGEELWNFSTVNSSGVFSSPALAEINGTRSVIFGSYDGHAYSLNASDGSMLWNYSIGTQVEGTPVVSKENGEATVVIGADDGTYAFNGTGDLKWSFGSGAVRGGIASADITGDGNNELVFGSDDNNTYALDQNGQQVWNFSTQDDVFSSPVIGDMNDDGTEEAAFGSEDGYLYIVNGSDGSELWSYDGGDSITSSPVFADFGSGTADLVFSPGKTLYAGTPETIEGAELELNIKADPTEPIEIYLENHYSYEREFNLTLYKGGAERNSTVLNVSGEENRTEKFNWTPEKIGTYNFTAVLETASDSISRTEMVTASEVGIQTKVLEEFEPFLTGQDYPVTVVLENKDWNTSTDTAVWLNETPVNLTLYRNESEAVNSSVGPFSAQTREVILPEFQIEEAGAYNFTLLLEGKEEVVSNESSSFSAVLEASDEEEVEIGVVVELNDETVRSCEKVPEGANAYEVVNSVEDIEPEWTYCSSFGHSLNKINDTGNDGNLSTYWNFYISKEDESSWTYSPVGFSAGLDSRNCWDRNYSSSEGHYCAEVGGDTLGFAYGDYGTEPDFFEFCEICGGCENEGDGDEEDDTDTSTGSGTPIDIDLSPNSKEWGSIDAGKSVDFSPPENTGLKKIEINAGQDLVGVSVEVKSVDEIPGEIQKPSGESYKFVNISHENLEEGDLDNVSFTFNVEKGWLEGKNYSKENVSLKRYINESWERLLTEILNETSEKIQFRSISSGFSYFAIAADVCQVGERRCQDNELQKCENGTEWVTVEVCDYMCNSSTLDCIERICELGQKRCNGDNVEICSEEGAEWEIHEVCEEGCENATCLTPQVEEEGISRTRILLSLGTLLTVTFLSILAWKRFEG
ncbi:MAG: PQQ-binding-like beta-propeller repeat protein [Candidatus Aenigmatarchaeota archaeon]